MLTAAFLPPNSRVSSQPNPNSLFTTISPASALEYDLSYDPSKDFRVGPYFTFGRSGLKLNPYGFYCGVVEIFFGLFWWAFLKASEVFYFCCRCFIGRELDANRKIPVLISSTWGWIIMKLTRNYPEIINREAVMEKLNGRACLYVANHCSWMDIPFVSAAIGYRNYKMVSKKELLKVPILGTAIRVGDNVILDRSNRRSQIDAYKAGMNWLKKNVSLMTFAEGTRSRDGRFQEFKRGAFKMAQTTSLPIVPMSIVYTSNVHPIDFVFPARSGKRIGARVVLHDPVETKDVPEGELMDVVRSRIASGLPDSQKPLNNNFTI